MIWVLGGGMVRKWKWYLLTNTPLIGPQIPKKYVADFLRYGAVGFTYLCGLDNSPPKMTGLYE